MGCEQQKPEWWRQPVSPGQAVHWGNCSRDSRSVVSMPDRYLDALIWAHSTYIALTDPEMSPPVRTLEGVLSDISKRGCSATERWYNYINVYVWRLGQVVVNMFRRNAQCIFLTEYKWSIHELRKMIEYLCLLKSSESEKVWDVALIRSVVLKVPYYAKKPHFSNV